MATADAEKRAETTWPAGDANQSLDEEAELAKHVDEKKLLRKLDLYIIPLIMALYLFSFLDRYVAYTSIVTHFLVTHNANYIPAESTLVTLASTALKRTSTSPRSSSRSLSPSSSSRTSSSRCPPT